MSATSNPHKNVYGKKKGKRRTYSGKQARMVKSIVRQEIALKEKKEVEMKSYDITHVNGNTFSYNGLVTNISSGIPRGTGPDERVGSEIFIKGILIRLQCVPNFQFNNCRLIIIRWNSSGFPSGFNIVQFTGAVGASMSPLVRDASHKFQVLYDQLVTIGTDQADALYTDKIYIKNVGRCVWDDTNGPQKGQIFMLAISDANPLGSPPGLFMHARVRYTDQ